MRPPLTQSVAGGFRTAPRRSAPLPSRPERVLVVSNIPTPYNDALFHHLARQPGVELHVAYCAASESNRSWRLSAEKTYDCTMLGGISLGGSVHVNPRIVPLVRRFSPDVAILSGSYTMPTLQLAALALGALGIPWLYWGEEVALDRLSVPRALVRHLMRGIVRRADGVLAIGAKAGRSYAGAGVRDNRIANFHYYPDADNFRLDPAARAAARASVRTALEIPNGAPVFLFCGQLIRRKAVDVLLAACASLHREGVACAVLVSGDGPDRAQLAALAGRLGVAAAVRFAGFAQPADLPRYFAAADVMVLPSRKEGWGVVVAEAMAAGLPVIASDQVNAGLELIEPGVSGFLFPVDDVAELARAMGVLCREPARLAAMSAAARALSADEAPQMAAARLVTLLRAADLRGSRNGNGD